jgi:hypothetical protein
MKRLRHEIRDFHKRVLFFSVGLLLLLMAGTAFSHHAAPNVVKAAIAKAAPKVVVIIIGIPDVPEPSTPAILALGGTIVLWRRRRANHSGSEIPG